jgi:chemotaxis signal transduction protein
VDVNDHLLLVRAGPARAALLVDEVEGVAECDEHEVIRASHIAASAKIPAAVKMKDGGIVLLENARTLADALDRSQLELPMNAL